MPRKSNRDSIPPTALRHKAANPKPDNGRRLSFADRYRLLETHRANPTWSWVKLAEETGVSTDTARMTCIAAGKSAADLMSAYAGPMLAQWLKAARAAANRGDHRPAKEWLLHAGSIDPIPETLRNSGPSVVIVNAPLPGMPQPTILLESPAAPNVPDLAVLDAGPIKRSSE